MAAGPAVAEEVPSGTAGTAGRAISETAVSAGAAGAAVPDQHGVPAGTAYSGDPAGRADTAVAAGPAVADQPTGATRGAHACLTGRRWAPGTTALPAVSAGAASTPTHPH